MKKHPVLFLFHILDCITRIERYSKDIVFDEFIKNVLIQDSSMFTLYYNHLSRLSLTVDCEAIEEYPTRQKHR